MITTVKRNALGTFTIARIIGAAVLVIAPRASADDEALIVTPPGFTRPGDAKTATGADTARLRITVRDRATGRPTPCRLNVVGPDGHFYQPAANPLSPYSLTGRWPRTGKGNREGKAPIRYLGRFFYTTGETEVAVPAGNVRVEAWKGFEYRPEVKNIAATAGQAIAVDIVLDRSLSMASLGYHSGDPHLHFDRKTETDDRVILDLLEAEDIRFGSILAYNEPPGPYKGVMAAMAAPSFAGWDARRSTVAARPGSPRARSIAARPMGISTSSGAMTWCSRVSRSTPTTGRCMARSAARPGSRADSPLMPTAATPRRSMPTSSGRVSTPSSFSSSACIGGSSWRTGTTSSTSATGSPASGRAITRRAASWAIAGPMFN